MSSWQHPKAPVQALIFDMDGTMIDSMGHHKQSWVAFAAHHGLDIEAGELMRRTTGRTVVECLNELFQTELEPECNRELAEQKEALYREAFGPVFREVTGFTEFAGLTRARGLKVGVGTAGDRHNIAFGMRAVALCTSRRAEELAGPQVIASANHYLDLMNSGFLETLYVATS